MGNPETHKPPIWLNPEEHSPFRLEVLLAGLSKSINIFDISQYIDKKSRIDWYFSGQVTEMATFLKPYVYNLKDIPEYKSSIRLLQIKGLHAQILNNDRKFDIHGQNLVNACTLTIHLTLSIQFHTNFINHLPSHYNVIFFSTFFQVIFLVNRKEVEHLIEMAYIEGSFSLDVFTVILTQS